ncbi:MAG: type IV pilus modification PilV family protein [Planctomycetota bacterium]|jgi:prepilin-type N-terminal cleavage/methylation domain-containing protein
MATARRHGFTLIETVAAIVILALAVPPMLWAVREAQHKRANPMMASRARWLAIERLEDVIADRHSGDGLLGYDNLAGSSETPITGFPAFDRTVTINKHGPWDNVGKAWSGVGTDYATVTVDIDWTDADGNAQTLSISTVLTKY